MVIPIYELRNDDKRKVFIHEVENIKVDSTVELQTASSIVKFMNEYFQVSNLVEERVYVIYFRYGCQVAGVALLSQGSYNKAFITPREVLVRGLLLDAHNFILIHNHPAGTIRPSSLDRDVTEKIKEAAELVGLKMVDHLIIGDGYFSFMENGLLF